MVELPDCIAVTPGSRRSRHRVHEFAKAWALDGCWTGLRTSRSETTVSSANELALSDFVRIDQSHAQRPTAQLDSVLDSEPLKQSIFMAFDGSHREAGHCRRLARGLALCQEPQQSKLTV